MIFRIRKKYRSAKNVEQIRDFFNFLAQKEDEALFGNRKKYKVKNTGADAWYVRKLGAARNGPDYPSIKIEIKSTYPSIVSLCITTSAILVIFYILFPLIFIFSAILADKIIINGVNSRPSLEDRLFFALFPFAIISVLAYFKSIKPVKNTEQWLVNELLLEEILD